MTVTVTPEMLDYDYIEQCSDISILRAIYENLLRNELGLYPDLESAVKLKLSALLPKKGRCKVALSSQEEVDREKLELQSWIEKSKNAKIKSNDLTKESSLPPVRQGAVAECVSSETNENEATTPTPTASKRIFRKENMSTREYFEAWEKFDVDAEAEDSDQDESRGFVKLDSSSIEVERKDEISLLRERLDNNEFTLVERKFMSETERVKGNELFQVKEIEKSIQCYTKSILLDDTNAKSFANRALAKMKCTPADLQGAINDCTCAINIDRNYIKAYVRRGTLRDKLGQYDAALSDFEAADKLDASGGYNRMAHRSKEKLLKHREKKKELCSNTSLKIVEVNGIGEELVNNEEGFDYEIYTPGCATESMSQASDQKACTPSSNSFARNLKKFFSSKTKNGKSSPLAKGGNNDNASSESENWCKVDILDESDTSDPEEADATTRRMTSHDSQTLCF